MRRLLVLALALAACASGDDGVEAPGPQDGVDVREVRVTLRVDPATLDIEGTAWLTVAHPAALATLDLGLDDALEVQAVRVDGREVDAQRVGDGLAVPLAGGDTSVVEVTYRGTAVTGLYRDDSERQTVAYTDGWPDRTAGWLPTVHHPSDPARLDLSLDVPAAYEAVAAGVAVRDSVAAGRRHVRFVLDGDAPPYTFAFALADFTVVEASGAVPIRHALLDGQAGLARRLDRTGAALDTLAALFGPYPYAAYATVQVPMTYAGMENAAAPFLRADLYRADVAGRNAVEEVNWHELVHQWWGNAVVPADWSDLWLAEGPATYLTAELYRRLDGEAAGRRHVALMARQLERPDARRALVPDAYADPADVLTPTVYQKGGAVLHTLRLVVGEAAFWQALRSVQVEFADRPLSTAAFQSAMEMASGQDLDVFFDLWVYGDTVPTLATRWDRDTRTLAWAIEGDAGTLAGVPFELLILQDGAETVVPATDGVASLPRDAAPDVWPVGVLVEVR